MRGRKSKHTAEFKVEAVRLMRQRMASGTTLQRVADELGVRYQLLRQWANDVDRAGPEATPEDTFPASRPKGTVTARLVLDDKDAEITRLRRENDRLRMERDILKKATAFFAKESQ